jgi:hypothetical protein
VNERKNDRKKEYNKAKVILDTVKPVTSEINIGPGHQSVKPRKHSTILEPLIVGAQDNTYLFAGVTNALYKCRHSHRNTHE